LLFGLTGSALRAGGVWVINEVLADPGAVNDANGDGNFDPVDDEYIEIVNLSGEDQDISLWTISDFVRVRHQFPEGTIVPNECAVVVFGSGPIGRPFTGATFQIASDGSLGLNNSGDTITFADDVGEVLATFQYGNDVGINPNDDAMVRDPDLTGEFVAHSTATNSGGDRISPGRMTGDDPFPGCPDEPPDPGDTGWVVNEFHSMPEPGVGDANLDGTVDDADEFVEIVNATGVEQDISGWVLADGTEGRHQFLPGTLVAHNCSIVVFGGSAEGLPFNGASVQAASSGGLDLDDGGDTIGLVNTNGDTLARLAYGPEGGTVGSRTRDPDVDGEFVDHAESRDDAFSPGTFSDGTRFRGCPDEPVEPDSIEIWEIQGSGDSSPLEGQTVLTAQNIVTAAIRHTRNANGFFLQTPEERSDDDDETSDGIFVYTASNDPPVEVGDIVDVVGDVQEFFDWTEMTNPRVTVRNSGSPLPDPIVLDETRPSPDQPQSPNELERYENMLVEFHDGTVTSTSDAFGNFLAVATPARAFREPGIRYPGEGAVPVWDGNPEVFEVDPDALDGDNVSPAAGAGITECHGPLTWRFGRYRVYPKVLTLDDEFEPRPVRERADGEFTVATQNLFQLVDDQDDPSTGERVISTAELRDRLAKHSASIREVLRSPDILCVQEAENISVLRELATKINEDDAGISYEAFLLDGSDPGGRNNGFLVRDTVEVDSVDQIGADATFALDGRDRQTFSRPPLLLRGSFLGGEGPSPIVVINVHMRSLLDIEEDSQGRFVRAKRLAQAQLVANEVQRLQVDDPEISLLVAGDFNAFEFTDGYVDSLGLITGEYDPDDSLLPGDDLVDPSLRNHVLDLDPLERYSTTFDGSAQAVDHILSSSELTPRVIETAYGRANADAPASFAGDGATALRSSDHDGLVVFIEVDGHGDTLFVRGDVNADSRIDLSDGAFIFNFLFLGGDSPPCMAAASSNGSARIELTSGIYLLNFLFLAGPAPTAPYPDCGPLTSDSDHALGCESFESCQI